MKSEATKDLFRQLIYSSGQSERQLAEKMGVSQSYLNKLKNGRASLKSLEAFIFLTQICEKTTEKDSKTK